MNDPFSEHLVPVSRSLRYYTREPQLKENVHLVYLLHGYGQLAFYFLRKIQDLQLPNVLFVAPEGMHRFYVNGTAGRVGASWMTKELRETDIAENTAALDALHQIIQKKYSIAKTTVIGFSQGGATAARWIANGEIEVDQFVSWASVFPPDISFPENLKNKQRNLFVLGKKDEFFTEDNQAKALNEYLAMRFETLRFDGAHDLDLPTLQHILK